MRRLFGRRRFAPHRTWNGARVLLLAIGLSLCAISGWLVFHEHILQSDAPLVFLILLGAGLALLALTKWGSDDLLEKLSTFF
jgi:hypothetical protein